MMDFYSELKRLLVEDYDVSPTFVEEVMAEQSEVVEAWELSASQHVKYAAGSCASLLSGLSMRDQAEEAMRRG